MAKTCLMNFLAHPIITQEIKIGNITLPEATEFKLLGVWLGPGLTWTSHVSRLILKLNHNMNLLKTSKRFLSRHSLLSVYYAHIFSHISYGITLWGNMVPSSMLSKLQHVQNQCLSYVFNKPLLDKDYKSNRILKIRDILWINNVKLGYKLLHSHLPTKILNLCTTNSNSKDLTRTHRYGTRNKNLKNLLKATTRNHYNSYLVKSIKEFNSLPEPLKKITNWHKYVQSFKNYCFTQHT